MIRDAEAGDLAEGIVLWNRGCSELYGYSKLEALGVDPIGLLKPSLPMPRAEFERFTYDWPDLAVDCLAPHGSICGRWRTGMCSCACWKGRMCWCTAIGMARWTGWVSTPTGGR